MDDQFLHLPRQDVDPEFKQKLFIQLTALDGQKTHQLHIKKYIATFIVAVIFLSFSNPTIRAEIENWVRQIIPFGEVELILLPPSSSVGGGRHSNNVVDQIQESEAQAILPYETPAWIPPEFTKDDTVSFVDYGNGELAISQNWSSNIEASLQLNILNNPNPQLVVGSSVTAENININGHEGVMYIGSWDMDTNQYQNNTINIVWVRDDISYFLAGENINRDDLLRIARSFN